MIKTVKRRVGAACGHRDFPLLLKGKQTGHAEDGLGVAHRTGIPPARLRRDSPVKANRVFFVPEEVFCSNAETKKGGNTRVLRPRPFEKDGGFFYFAGFRRI